MSEDDLIFIAAAILLAKIPIDESNIKKAASDARKLRNEVAKQRAEIKANAPDEARGPWAKKR